MRRTAAIPNIGREPAPGEELSYITSPKRPSQLDSRLGINYHPVCGEGAHEWINRRTGGRVGENLRIGAGLRKPAPTLLLEHRGRKSGKTFVSPLLYIADGPNFIVVASAAGGPDDPQCSRAAYGFATRVRTLTPFRKPGAVK